MTATARTAYDDLMKRVKKIQLLASAGGVLHWDMETYMPDGGAGHRSEQVSLISGMVHEMFTAPEIGQLLAKVEASDLVSDPLSDEAVNVRELRREYERQVKVPNELVEELSRITARAHIIWRDARKNADFEAFRPILEEIVHLVQQKADAIGTGETRYDTLMDGYESGMTSREMAEVFKALGDELSPFVERIVTSGRTPDRSIWARDYPKDSQHLLGQLLISRIGFSLRDGRVDTTTHPFCTGLGPGDTRVTTRYNERNLSDSLFGMLHEAGHGMYDQGLDPDHYGTPRGESVSLGIHESQSRMWENIVGRSRPFWEYAFPLAQGFFPGSLGSVALDDLYWAVNDVQRSFIRVEADEATYNLHVLLRFELEQAIIGGDLPVEDIPGAWNDRMRQLLQTTPPDDAQGCLQDVHWSGGMFGYFPTYTLGNLYAAQFFEQAGKDIGDLDDMFRRGEFSPLLQWLRENIHLHGMRYRASDLVKKVTGRPLSHAPLTNHLRRKLGPLYGIPCV